MSERRFTTISTEVLQKSTKSNNSKRDRPRHVDEHWRIAYSSSICNRIFFSIYSDLCVHRRWCIGIWVSVCTNHTRDWMRSIMESNSHKPIQIAIADTAHGLFVQVWASERASERVNECLFVCARTPFRKIQIAALLQWNYCILWLLLFLLPFSFRYIFYFILIFCTAMRLHSQIMCVYFKCWWTNL